MSEFEPIKPVAHLLMLAAKIKIKNTILSRIRSNRIDFINPRFKSLEFKFSNRFYLLTIVYIENRLTEKGNNIVQKFVYQFKIR